MTKEFVLQLIKAIVSSKEEVNIDHRVDNMGTLLTIYTNPKDIGVLIGKNGDTIKAVRRLARVVGMANNEKVSIKINEPNRK